MAMFYVYFGQLQIGKVRTHQRGDAAKPVALLKAREMAAAHLVACFGHIVNQSANVDSKAQHAKVFERLEREFGNVEICGEFASTTDARIYCALRTSASMRRAG